MTCKGCGRLQRIEHLTGEGLCVFCAPVATWPATWTRKVEPREVRA